MRELLERHRPILRFDRQYDYRVSSPLGMLENPGNLLRRGDGEVIARAGGDPPLSFELLTAYPEGVEPRAGDCLSAAPDVLGDARRMEAEERYAGRLYGDAVEDDDGRTWLQYWFWLYYNPKNLFGFGKHEGDWEMIQIGLRPDGKPELATYAQHDTGEARSWDEVHTDESGLRPIVYVSPYSHASYFEPGTHPYPVGIDHPYGDGPAQADLPVEPLGPWAEWPGRWGNSERVIIGKIGNGPPSPGHQRSKWRRPAAFHRSMRRRRARSIVGRAMHRLGRFSYPNQPQVEGRLEGRRCLVGYRLAQSRLRRSRHLYLTVHVGERVIASRVVRDVDRAGSSATETILLAEAPATCRLMASTFNRLRQRSDIAEVDVSKTAAEPRSAKAAASSGASAAAAEHA